MLLITIIDWSANTLAPGGFVKSKATLFGLGLVLFSQFTFASSRVLIAVDDCDSSSDVVASSIHFNVAKAGAVRVTVDRIHWPKSASPASDENEPSQSRVSSGEIRRLQLDGTTIVDRETGLICAEVKANVFGSAHMKATKNCRAVVDETTMKSPRGETCVYKTYLEIGSRD